MNVYLPSEAFDFLLRGNKAAILPGDYHVNTGVVTFWDRRGACTPETFEVNSVVRKLAGDITFEEAFDAGFSLPSEALEALRLLEDITELTPVTIVYFRSLL
tara:strand:+ start:85 stop:390 length:306 start_codon:yes stop_codon:yes gene_type:complete